MPINNIKEVTISMLKINLHTNIPSNYIVTLAHDMLYQPTDKKSKKLSNLYYPYFTFDIKYSNEILYNMSYEERKKFFFDYDTYVEVLKDMILLQKTSPDEKEDDILNEEYDDNYGIDITDKEKNEEIIIEYLNEYNEELYRESNKEESEKIKKIIKDIDYARKEISDHNISLMLEVLFPTTFPTVNDVNDSFNQNIKEALNTKLSIKGELPSLIQPLISGIQIPYSYISINTSKYTVVKTLWLNDFLNHPRYKELIINFNKFYNDNHKNNNFLEKKIIKTSRTIFNNFTLLNENTFDKNTESFENDIKLSEESENKYGKKNVNLYANIYGILNLIRKIYKKIKKIKKEKNYSKNKIIEILDSIDDIEYMYKISSQKIYFPQNVKNFIEDLIKETRLPRSLNGISKMDESSFKNISAININDPKNKNIVDSLNEIYPSYVNFLSLLNNFVKPNYQTTHLQLQKLFNDYVKGTNGNLYDLIKNYIKTKFLLNSPTDLLLEEDPTINTEIFSDNYLYIGLNFSDSMFGSNANSNNNQDLVNDNNTDNTDNTNNMFYQGGENESENVLPMNKKNNSMDLITYEIDVLIDLIGGEINNENINDIKCKYKSESLGNMFVRLINKKYPWNVDKKRFYITVDELSITENKNKPKTLKQKYGLKSKQGGKRYTIKYKK